MVSDRMPEKSSRLQATKVIVTVPKETNRLLARGLQVGAKEMEEFWVDRIRWMILCILASNEPNLPPEREKRAFDVSVA